MNTPPEPSREAHRITPECQPVFPCWLWHPFWREWKRITDNRFGPDVRHMSHTHWHPDQPTPPAVTPTDEPKATQKPNEDGVDIFCRAHTAFHASRDKHTQFEESAGHILEEWRDAYTAERVKALEAARDEALKQAKLGWERHAEKDRAYGQALKERDDLSEAFAFLGLDPASAQSKLLVELDRRQKAESQLDRLRAELAEARKDRERLDWLFDETRKSGDGWRGIRDPARILEALFASEDGAFTHRYLHIKNRRELDAARTPAPDAGREGT